MTNAALSVNVFALYPILYVPIYCISNNVLCIILHLDKNQTRYRCQRPNYFSLSFHWYLVLAFFAVSISIEPQKTEKNFAASQLTTIHVCHYHLCLYARIKTIRSLEQWPNKARRQALAHSLAQMNFPRESWTEQVTPCTTKLLSKASATSKTSLVRELGPSCCLSANNVRMERERSHHCSSAMTFLVNDGIYCLTIAHRGAEPTATLAYPKKI